MELFSIRIQRTFQLVSTEMNAFAKHSPILQTFQNLCVGFVHYGVI